MGKSLRLLDEIKIGTSFLQVQMLSILTSQRFKISFSSWQKVPPNSIAFRPHSPSQSHADEQDKRGETERARERECVSFTRGDHILKRVEAEGGRKEGRKEGRNEEGRGGEGRRGEGGPLCFSSRHLAARRCAPRRMEGG